MKYNSEYFNQRDFTKDQVQMFFDGAIRDLLIAKKDSFNEVIFTFTYNAFLKLGITCIAINGHKIKSRQGHHIKIIDKMSEFIDDENIKIYGEAMRRRRNVDLYAGGSTVSEKEIKEYLNFTIKLSEKIKKLIK